MGTSAHTFDIPVFDMIYCSYLLNTGMYGAAPVRNAVFLRPAIKGVLGWARNILNTSRSLTYAVFNIPALTVLHSLEQEYVIMSKQLHIHALFNDASRDLNFLKDLITENPDLAKQHSWFVGIIARNAMNNVSRGYELVREAIK